MAAPAFLQSPRVREWLGGIEPAWTLLEFDSFNALRRAPSRDERAIRLAANISGADFAASAVASNAQRLLKKAGDSGGLKLTASGNLTRAIVAEMRDTLEWPDYDKDATLWLSRVVNEPDIPPLYFVRVLCQEAGLMRRYRGSLRLTQIGKRVTTAPGRGGLQAILFHVTFWLTNLAHFDRFPLASWPQPDIGIVLWSLSTSAVGWETPGRLMRLCTVPVIGVLEAKWDFPTWAFEARILRPLTWFGLLEARQDEPVGSKSTRPRYRKTPFFDRFVSFDVQLEKQTAVRH
jgi:hypothetical protein